MTNRGSTLYRKVKAAAAALAVAIAVATLAEAAGDDYQFIDPTTYPAANVSYSARSAAIAVNAGALRVASAPDNLEARTRTKCASNVIELETDRLNAMIIMLH